MFTSTAHKKGHPLRVGFIRHTDNNIQSDTCRHRGPYRRTRMKRGPTPGPHRRAKGHSQVFGPSSRFGKSSRAPGSSRQHTRTPQQPTSRPPYASGTSQHSVPQAGKVRPGYQGHGGRSTAVAPTAPHTPPPHTKRQRESYPPPPAPPLVPPPLPNPSTPPLSPSSPTAPPPRLTGRTLSPRATNTPTVTVTCTGART